MLNGIVHINYYQFWLKVSRKMKQWFILVITRFFPSFLLHHLLNTNCFLQNFRSMHEAMKMQHLFNNSEWVIMIMASSWVSNTTITFSCHFSSFITWKCLVKLSSDVTYPPLVILTMWISQFNNISLFIVSFKIFGVLNPMCMFFKFGVLKIGLPPRLPWWLERYAKLLQFRCRVKVR